MTDTRWLHNMSVPPRTTLTVQRGWLGARYFDVRPCLDVSGADVLARPALRADTFDHGAAGLLAFLVETVEPLDTWRERIAYTRCRLERDPSAAAQLDRLFDTALAEAQVPCLVGVFVAGTPRPRCTTHLGLTASLAVLAHRSGPLYLPGRRVDPSLVVLTRGLLAFPGPPRRLAACPGVPTATRSCHARQ